MTRPIILGNGNLLACIDKHARIRDFYYPYVGQENHVSSNRHRIGIWVNGVFSWVSLDEWDLSVNYKKDTLVSEVIASHNGLKIELVINEAVHHENDIFLRRMCVTSKDENVREIKVFFSQHFQISETNIGDTVFYNPILDSIMNYKGKRYFLIGGVCDKKPFDDYATGAAGEEGKEGTWRDAEDGFLSKNPIEHGSVDSTIGFTFNLGKDEKKFVDYWITVGKKYGEVKRLRDLIIKEGTAKLIDQTDKYWSTWVKKKQINFHKLDEVIKQLFYRSLLIVRAQTDNRGAIIAANDTHTFHSKKDTYSYMWPRDGALIARSLDKVGHHDITKMFFKFCSGIITEGGYLLHKYRPDGSFGSSWHPWVKGSKPQLPIQEDETALILDALWKHYQEHEDTKMIKSMYKSFIKPAGDFLMDFRDGSTNLPKESYDLWEEKLGVHTFTACTVYAGLEASKNFAEIFGNKVSAKKYAIAASETRQAILEHLYDKENQIFVKGIYYDKDNKMVMDKTIDSSTPYGLFEFKVLNIDDPRMTRTLDKTKERLWNKRGCGGMARYENDGYYAKSPDQLENPWFISTLWLAEYYIAKAKTCDDIKAAEDLIYWASERALLPGTMSEQIDPVTGDSLSVAPLTWSHAAFIIAVVKFIDKYEKLACAI